LHKDHVGPECYQLRHRSTHALDVATDDISEVDLWIVAFAPAELLQLLLKCSDAHLPFRIVFGESYQGADTARPLGLCVCNKWEPHRSEQISERNPRLIPMELSTTSPVLALTWLKI